MGRRNNLRYPISKVINMADGGNIQFYLFGAALRLGLLHSGLFGLSERPELATPLNSYKRLREGIVLSQNDQDPYAGVLFHETPLALKFFTFLFSHMSESCVNLVFIIGDILTAFVLGKVAELIATNLLSKQAKSVKSYHTDAREDLLIKFEDVVFMPYYVQLAYLLNPYLVASCAAKTTTVFANLLLALFLWSALKKKLLPACLFLALATYQSFYPVMLLVPLCLMLLPEPENEESSSSNDVKLTSMTVMTTFAITLGTIYYLSYLVMDNSWTFMYSTLGFTLAVPELTPNMGLFWYFFTEMFEHFRVFFCLYISNQLLCLCLSTCIEAKKSALLTIIVSDRSDGHFQILPKLRRCWFLHFPLAYCELSIPIHETVVHSCQYISGYDNPGTGVIPIMDL